VTTLEAIARFLVPAAVIRETDGQLRAAGYARSECFVLWSGVQEHDTFQIRTAHVPRQTAYRSPDGLCVRVEGDELHRLNVWLFEHGEHLAVQVHSHPTEAYHSETDDTYPIVTVRGGLSLVVPNFGRAGLLGNGVAYYRLGFSGWDELSLDEAKRIIQWGD
jgi:Prokaryotic homologs of the JAB domain